MTSIRVSYNFDPDRHYVGLHLGSNCLQKAFVIRQLTKLSTGMQRLLMGRKDSYQSHY